MVGKKKKRCAPWPVRVESSKKVICNQIIIQINNKSQLFTIVATIKCVYAIRV